MQERKDGFDGERALILPLSVVQEMEKDPLSSLLHITDIGYYPKARYHTRERKEPINQFVFIYCVDGAGSYRFGEQEYNVTANHYFILPAGNPHAYRADRNNPWTIYWIHFKGKMASYFARRITGPIEVKPGLSSRIYNRTGLFEEIFHTLEMGYSHENLLYACSAFQYYLGTLHYLQQYRDVVRNNTSEETNVVTAAIHYIRENLEKKLTVADIAAYTGYSPSHFSALFSKRTGYAPLTYLNQLKIQQACKLLDFTDMKINQICYKIGIEDVYYFSRLFHKTMKISPTAYRKQKKG